MSDFVSPLQTLQTQLSSDVCIKCNICTAACPVAAVTDLFPGPKAVGPQMQRLRLPGGESPDKSLDYCSGCGVCTLVCPHGVEIAEMNAIARSAQWQRDGIPLRNRLLGRSEWLGKLGSLFWPLSDIPLQTPFFRMVAERLFGVARQPGFPRFVPVGRRFRRWFARWARRNPASIGKRKVAFFHGCSTNYWEPRIGQAAVKVLAHNGVKVITPPQNCCGLPMQSNGEFGAARAYAMGNVRKLAPYVKENYAIVGTSTSCTLSLKHDYRRIQGLDGDDVQLVAENTYDIFEFLLMLHREGQLNTRFKPVNRTVFYHPPCQQRSHFIGQPAVDVLRLVPGLKLVQSTADCCGVAGTYGLKAEKYQISLDVGKTLFDQIESAGADEVACDSETCRWWIDTHAGGQTRHPIELLAEAYGLNIEGDEA